MKMTIDMPSAAIGAATSAAVILAFTSPVLQPLSLFDYSETSPIWVAAGLLALGAAAVAIRTKPSFLSPKDRGFVSHQARHVQEQFPSGIRRKDLPVAMKPVEWVATRRASAPYIEVKSVDDILTVVERGLAAQVTHEVDSILNQALLLAFEAFAKGGSNPTRFVVALTERMQASLLPGAKPFDLREYSIACRDMGHVDNGRSRSKYSRFSTVNLVHALMEARKESGVLASAEFVWLKEMDRTLWYALNNAGRRAFHIEAAGIMAHYQRQKASSETLVKPEVDDAVNGVMHYFEIHGIDPVAATARRP